MQLLRGTPFRVGQPLWTGWFFTLSYTARQTTLPLLPLLLLVLLLFLLLLLRVFSSANDSGRLTSFSHNFGSLVPEAQQGWT